MLALTCPCRAIGIQRAVKRGSGRATTWSRTLVETPFFFLFGFPLRIDLWKWKRKFDGFQAPLLSMTNTLYGSRTSGACVETLEAATPRGPRQQ